MNSRRIALFLFASALMLSVSHAAEPALPGRLEQAFESYISYPSTLVPVLESVQDQASADAAAPRLRREIERLYDLRSGLQGITSLTPDQQVVIKTRYERSMREQWGKVYEQIFRLQKARCYQSRDFSQLFRLLCMMLQK